MKRQVNFLNWKIFGKPQEENPWYIENTKVYIENTRHCDENGHTFQKLLISQQRNETEK